MAPHSSVLAWRMPRTGLPSMGLHRVGHNWSDLAAAAAAAGCNSSHTTRYGSSGDDREIGQKELEGINDLREQRHLDLGYSLGSFLVCMWDIYLYLCNPLDLGCLIHKQLNCPLLIQKSWHFLSWKFYHFHEFTAFLKKV